MTVLDQIARQRIVPVLRSSNVQDAVATARALGRAGMRVVELTRTTPGVEDAVRALRDDDLTVGVGTISDVAHVRSAAAAGARFVVSFGAPDDMVEEARELGLVAIPGALTATEVSRCLDRGAQAVKLFPARAISPGYLRDLRAVMPELRAIVTGGLLASPSSVVPWLDAGAIAVGLGSDLGSVADHGAMGVMRRARQALGAAEEVLA